jgi:membrane protein required for beta-lactamase induction
VIKPNCSNHDLDFGEGVLCKYVKESTAQWLLSNCDSFSTKEPLATCLRHTILECNGVRVGVMGLVEQGLFYYSFVLCLYIYRVFVCIGRENVTTRVVCRVDCDDSKHAAAHLSRFYRDWQVDRRNIEGGKR